MIADKAERDFISISHTQTFFKLDGSQLLLHIVICSTTQSKVGVDWLELQLILRLPQILLLGRLFSCYQTRHECWVGVMWVNLIGVLYIDEGNYPEISTCWYIYFSVIHLAWLGTMWYHLKYHLNPYLVQGQVGRMSPVST